MNDLSAFDEAGVYDAAPAPRKQPRSYKDLAAKVNGKLAAAQRPSAPVAAAPGGPAAGATIQNPAGTVENAPGTMGFGDIMQSPEAWLAGEKLAGLHGDASSLAMMNAGKPAAVPYGGTKAWSEAAAEGLKTGIGMYNFMKREGAVADALRNYKELFDKRAAQQADKRLVGAFAQGKGSGQHSVQGDSDYEYDL